MNKDSTKITFINHASILIKNDDIGLLSDPWYQGDAFHKGWNLIHEFDDDEIYKSILSKFVRLLHA